MFETGEIVKLKSGGPKMTVGYIYKEGFNKITCFWFDGCTYCAHPFPEVALVKVLEEGQEEE